jgi:hypothetical protein
MPYQFKLWFCYNIGFATDAYQDGNITATLIYLNKINTNAFKYAFYGMIDQADADVIIEWVGVAIDAIENEMSECGDEGQEIGLPQINTRNDQEILDLFDVDIIPNPASDFVQIDIPLTMEPVRLMITDKVGKVVSNEMIEYGQLSIAKDISNLSGGMYFVTAVADGNKVTEKLIVLK